MTASLYVVDSSKAVGPTPAQIMMLLRTRQSARNPVIAQMIQIRDVVNDEIVVPLPSMDAAAKPAVANMLAIGLNQMGMRVGEVLPDIWYPPAGEKAGDIKRARERRYANLAWWQVSKMELKLRRRARHLGGYGQTGATIRPDFKREVPVWQVRDPLTTFPAPMPDPDDIVPYDVIYTYTRDWQWLKANYPDQVRNLDTGVIKLDGTNDPKPDLLFTLIEYMDEECTVLLAQGRGQQQPGMDYSQMSTSAGLPFVELLRVANRTGMCQATVGGTINLDRPRGLYDGMVGMYIEQARLSALNTLAVEKSIYPDQFLVSRQNETARFLAGPYEGRSGKVNVVTGGDMHIQQAAPSPNVQLTIDHMERGQRVSGAIPPEYGGESGGNIRTGKRGDAVMSATVDHHVAEAQSIMRQCLYEENRIAAAVDQKYFGSRKKSFFLTLGKVQSGFITYTPNEAFADGTDHVVTYPMTGADANGIVVGGGQRVGLGTMSKKTFMEIDPEIADVEREERRLLTEQLDQALLGSLQQKVQAGTLPPTAMVRIIQLYSNSFDLADAVAKVDAEMSKQQATPAPMGDPATAPGLATPGTGAEAPVAPGDESMPGIANLSDIARMLHGSSRPAVPMKG